MSKDISRPLDNGEPAPNVGVLRIPPRRNSRPRTCNQCERAFYRYCRPRDPLPRFCSVKCFARYRRGRRKGRNGYSKVCPTCNSTFYVFPKDRRKFCRLRCWRIYQRQKYKKHEIFKRRPILWVDREKHLICCNGCGRIRKRKAYGLCGTCQKIREHRLMPRKKFAYIHRRTMQTWYWRNKSRYYCVWWVAGEGYG